MALLNAEQREQAIRRSSEAAESKFEAKIRTLSDKLVDCEAAFAKLNAAHEKQGNWKRILPLTQSSAGLERKLIRSGLMDADWYAGEYKDVSESGLSPAKHYLEVGYLRGYRPNPLFDTRWYLERYAEARLSGQNPLLHYITRGFREGCDPSVDFQTDFYLEANPDVRNNGMNPLAHYLRYGRSEGRLPIRPGQLKY